MIVMSCLRYVYVLSEVSFVYLLYCTPLVYYCYCIYFPTELRLELELRLSTNCSVNAWYRGGLLLTAYVRNSRLIPEKFY